MPVDFAHYTLPRAVQFDVLTELVEAARLITPAHAPPQARPTDEERDNILDDYADHILARV